MPALYYGTILPDRTRRLYNDLQIAYGTSIFDHYKIDNLAPYSQRRHVANFWWITINPRHPHSALAWHDERGHEALVLMPGQLMWTETLTLAREIFEPLIPSAITFRLNNPEEPYLYA